MKEGTFYRVEKWQTVRGIETKTESDHETIESAMKEFNSVMATENGVWFVEIDKYETFVRDDIMVQQLIDVIDIKKF